MAARKHKHKRRYKRRYIPKFTRIYEQTLQDDPFVYKEKQLQKIHDDIAKLLFNNIPNYNFGEWKIKFDKLILYIDSDFGLQVEIEGTSTLPLIKRLKIHAKLLRLLRKGHCILKAVESCLSTLTTQSKNLMNLSN